MIHCRTESDGKTTIVNERVSGPHCVRVPNDELQLARKLKFLAFVCLASCITWPKPSCRGTHLSEHHFPSYSSSAFLSYGCLIRHWINVENVGKKKHSLENQKRNNLEKSLFSHSDQFSSNFVQHPIFLFFQRSSIRTPVWHFLFECVWSGRTTPHNFVQGGIHLRKILTFLLSCSGAFSSVSCIQPLISLIQHSSVPVRKYKVISFYFSPSRVLTL